MCWLVFVTALAGLAALAACRYAFGKWPLKLDL